MCTHSILLSAGGSHIHTHEIHQKSIHQSDVFYSLFVIYIWKQPPHTYTYKWGSQLKSIKSQVDLTFCFNFRKKLKKKSDSLCAEIDEIKKERETSRDFKKSKKSRKREREKERERERER